MALKAGPQDRSAISAPVGAFCRIHLACAQNSAPSSDRVDRHHSDLHLCLRANMVQPLYRWPQEDAACYERSLFGIAQPALPAQHRLRIRRRGAIREPHRRDRAIGCYLCCVLDRRATRGIASQALSAWIFSLMRRLFHASCRGLLDGKTKSN